MEEDVDGDMADIETLNYDDLDSVSKLQKTQRYLDIMQVIPNFACASIFTWHVPFKKKMKVLCFYCIILPFFFYCFLFLVDLIFSSSAMEHVWFNLSCIGDSAWSFSFIVLLFVPCDTFLQVLGL